MCYTISIMSLFKKEEFYLGIDIGAGGMKLVELRKTKGRPQLWTYGVMEEPMDIHAGGVVEKTAATLLLERQTGVQKDEPAPPAPPVDMSDPRIERYAHHLRQLVERSRASSRMATASLPVSQIFHTVVTLPPVEEKELAFHVLAKVKKMLPRPTEEMQVVHQRISLAGGTKEIEGSSATSPKDIKVLVTAAPKTLVAFYTAVFARAGLKLLDLETEAFALERSLVGLDTATVMVVDMGAERTNFFIMDAGLPITHRTLQMGGNDIDAVIEKRLEVKREDARQVKADMSATPLQIPTEPFLPMLDPIVKEIQYSFELFLSQSGNEGKKPEKVILTGGAAMFPPVASVIGEGIGLKTFVGDPWARVVYQDGLRRVLDGIGPRMSVSIGLALRHVVD